MKKEKKKTMVTFRVSESEKELLDKIVHHKKESRSQYIRSNVLAHLEQITNIY